MNYKDMNHIVIDIETLGINAGCPIIQIGAVHVKDGEITDTFNCYPQLENQLLEGFRIETDTLRWWLKHAVQLDKIFSEQNVILKTCLNAFIDFIQWTNVLYWGCSPSFDLDILAYAMRHYGFNVPWMYWQERDIRTIRNEAFIGDFKPKNDYPHDALADATEEAEILIKAVWG